MNLGYIMIAAGVCIFFGITWYMIQKVHLEVLNLKSFICDEVLKYIESEIKRLEGKKTPNELREEAGFDRVPKVVNGKLYTAEEWSKQFDNVVNVTQTQDVLDDLCCHYVSNVGNDGKCEGVGHRGKLKEECSNCDFFVGVDWSMTNEESIKFCGKEKHPYA